MSIGIYLAEHGILPDSLLAYGIRQQIKLRIKDCVNYKGKLNHFINTLHQSPVAIRQDAANEQHYEVPAQFYKFALGKHLKYSSAYWPEGCTHLDEAEAEMLRLSCERAELSDGQEILEIGCGWGSLTLWMAKYYPNARITAISNSNSQRQYIEQQCLLRGFKNVTIITGDVTQHQTERTFDRIVSVECFEHLRNYAFMFEKLSQWMRSDGMCFIHVFCHSEYAYPFEDKGEDNWMAKNFFTGGIMPSYDLFKVFNKHLCVSEQWKVNGTHYEKTADAWLQNMDTNKNNIEDMFSYIENKKERGVQFNRWRMFFMACREMFGYNNGNDWFVGHYKLKNVNNA